MQYFIESIWPVIEVSFVVAGGIAAIWAVIQLIRSKFFSRITWRHAIANAECILKAIEHDSWSPDYIIGIGRSGAIWGGWLAGNLGSKPIIVFDRYFEDEGPVRKIRFPLAKLSLQLLAKELGPAPKLLLVEGATSSGQGFKDFLEIVKESWPEANVRTASLFSNAGSSIRPDYVGSRDLSPWPSRFPWHHRRVYRRHIGHRVK